MAQPEAYVVRQLVPDGPWFVVDSSGPSVLRNAQGDPIARPGVDGRPPMEAMTESAELRQAWVERHTPEDSDDHVLFVAVVARELGDFGVRQVKRLVQDHPSGGTPTGRRPVV